MKCRSTPEETLPLYGTLHSVPLIGITTSHAAMLPFCRSRRRTSDVPAVAPHPHRRRPFRGLVPSQRQPPRNLARSSRIPRRKRRPSGLRTQRPPPLTGGHVRQSSARPGVLNFAAKSRKPSTFSLWRSQLSPKHGASSLRSRTPWRRADRRRRGRTPHAVCRSEVRWLECYRFPR
jgi:hypothetical protein